MSFHFCLFRGICLKEIPASSMSVQRHRKQHGENDLQRWIQSSLQLFMLMLDNCEYSFWIRSCDRCWPWNCFHIFSRSNCTPQGLSSLIVMYSSDTADIIIKELKDIRAERCVCQPTARWKGLQKSNRLWSIWGNDSCRKKYVNPAFLHCL